MDIFFEVINRLDKLDLIIRIDKELSKMDIRPVDIYSISEDNNEIVVSQTNPPLNRDMVGKELEASFVASITKAKLERFFFLAGIEKIGLFGVSRNKIVEAIFLRPIDRKIYKRSLRIYPRINCEQDPVYISIIPGGDRFKVIDISEGGLCFKCEKNLANSIRFIPQRKLDIAVEFSDMIIPVRAQIIRRFEQENKGDDMFIGIKFLEFPNNEEKELSSMIKKLREKKK